jgi:DNA-binding NtrC family response regulator
VLPLAIGEHSVSSASPSILIVDDDPTVLTAVSRFFKQQGWHMAAAGGQQINGIDALGVSTQMQSLASQVAHFARSDVSVLLTGEVGTGKGWIAKLIHALSPRANKPLVDVCCNGFPMPMLELELFGNEKGATPDTAALKMGVCEVVNGGTLFLDEIDNLSLSLQSRVLDMIRTGRFCRVGGTREIAFEGRIIAATHHTLETAVRDGRLNAELYHAINTASLRVPPLRERSREDFEHVTTAVLRTLQRNGSNPRVSQDAISLLVKHDWPGNVRELRLTLERALLRAGSDQIEAYHLPFELRARGTPGKHVRMGDDDLTLDSVVKRHIANVVARFGGNRAEAARALGVTRGTIYNKLRDEP